MTLSQIAYTHGSRAALEKFAAPPMPPAGGLNAIAPVAPTVPGTPAATMKPGAPNQALPTSPVLGTGVPGMPTVASMGKTQAQGSMISAPPTAAPATPTTAKAASMFAPSAAPKAAKIPREHSTIGSNITTETAKSVAPAASAAPAVGSAAGSAAAPAASAISQGLGGIVPSTGQTPAAALANDAAGSFGNQVRAVTGGGK